MKFFVEETGPAGVVEFGPFPNPETARKWAEQWCMCIETCQKLPFTVIGPVSGSKPRG